MDTCYLIPAESCSHADTGYIWKWRSWNNVLIIFILCYYPVFVIVKDIFSGCSSYKLLPTCNPVLDIIGQEVALIEPHYRRG